jgi:hypothetical protein
VHSKWYEIVDFELNNAIPFGDVVGVVTKWTHPATLTVPMSPATIEAIKAAVGTEPRWREYVTAEMWVGKAVGPILGLDPVTKRQQVQTQLTKLMDLGVLGRVAAQDHTRQERWFVLVQPGATGGAPASGPVATSEQEPL